MDVIVRTASDFMALVPMPLLIAAGAGLLLVLAICTFAMRGPRSERSAAVSRCVLVVLAGVLSASLIWGYFDNAGRQALELRAGQLNAQALQPGSPFACLNALTGDGIDVACEKTVFASSANVAAAISYVAAEFSVLGDMADYSARGGRGLDSTMMPLRRALEADPYGFLAHVLAVRDGCTGGNCPPLKVLRNAAHVRMNLVAQTLDHYVEQYREAWARSPEAAITGTVAEAAPFAPAAPVDPRKAKASIDFPSAASIPAISIMNPEPKAGEPKPAPAPRPAEGATKPAPASAPPFLAAPSPQSEPVWLPPSTQAAPAAQATP